MKKIALSIALSTMIISTAHSDTEVNTQQLVDESRQIIMGFGKSLKGELKTALKTGGL
ncbi:MAG: hypothetical protein QNL62_12330 [Gammaproteobacteria bacterium]|nr:hypothetical protein [Gammaproteobacteria bacterium]